MDLTPGQQEVWALHEQGLSHRQIAEHVGKNRKTVWELLERAKRRMNLDDGIADALGQTGIAPEHARMGYRKIKDPDTGSFNTVMWKLPPEAAEDLAARMIEAFADIPPAPKVEPPETYADDTLALFVISDWHYGATITADEAGQDYNRAIAEERIRTGFIDTNASIPPSEVAIILYNGDTTHANDDKDRTPRSGHGLKVEGSHQSNLFGVETICEWQILTALERHGRVIFAIKKGNHDPNTPTPIIMALRARFRDEPRVEIVDNESPWFTFRMNRVFIASHHGHGIPVKEMALSVPHKFREDWGAADFHFLYTAHRHSFAANTLGGLRHRQLPSVCSIEQHASESGYTDTSGMYAARFDTLTGRVSENSVMF